MAKVYLNFDSNQLEQIGKAYRNKAGVSLKLEKSQFDTQGIPINLTTAQLESLKHGNNIVKFSKTSVQSFGNKVIKFHEKHGGILPIFAALAPLIPFLTKAAAVAVPAATSIVSAISNKKHNDRMLAESQRQTQLLQALPQGSGMKLWPAKRGSEGSGMQLWPAKRGSGMKLYSKKNLL